jgi:hypothetical protein
MFASSLCLRAVGFSSAIRAADASASVISSLQSSIIECVAGWLEVEGFFFVRDRAAALSIDCGMEFGIS